MKNIGIIGCGWLGIRLATILSGQFKIFVTVRSHEKINTLKAKGFNPTFKTFGKEILSNTISEWEVLKDLDIIIITVPFSHKTESSDSLQEKLNQLALFIKDFKGQIFFMSSTGVYPNIEKEFFEDDVSLNDVEGERLIFNKFPQVNILRLGGLMGDDRLLIKYNVSHLNSPVNHIHYVDIAGAIEKMICLNKSAQLYNLVAPKHPSKSNVIASQKHLDNLENENPNPDGRIISPEKLIKALDFVFTYPDPKYFHLDKIE